MKYCLILFFAMLTACSSLPTVKQLPAHQGIRIFKVEQVTAENQLQQASLLTLQMDPQQWRWVQTDPLGAPLARVILTKQGWQNDGFVMPNQQARQLFSALSTALNPQQPLFDFSVVRPISNGADYFVKQKKVWQIRQLPSMIEIDLSDHSHWRIEELN